MAVREWTRQEIERLVERARSGENDALYDLQIASRLIAKRANQRMNDLEKQGFVHYEDGELKGTQAYDKAKYFLQEQLGLKHFSEGGKRSIDQIEDQIYAALEYNNSLSSTAAGVRTMTSTEETKGLEELAERFTGEGTYSTKKMMLDFFQSDYWQEMRSYGGGSPEQLKEAMTAITERGAKISDLKKQFEKYKKGKVDSFKMWKNWTAGKKSHTVMQNLKNYAKSLTKRK